MRSKLTEKHKMETKNRGYFGGNKLLGIFLIVKKHVNKYTSIKKIFSDKNTKMFYLYKKLSNFHTFCAKFRFMKTSYE